MIYSLQYQKIKILDPLFNLDIILQSQSLGPCEIIGAKISYPN